MVTIPDDFVSDTAKVRLSGDSLIVGLDKGICELLEISKRSTIQIYYKKIGDRPPIDRRTAAELRKEHKAKLAKGEDPTKL